jgi:hypothetical protein
MAEYAPTCDGCREIYRQKDVAAGPPCDTCREEPLEENDDALRIFFLVKDQVIMGMSGPVAINHQAVHEAMRLYRIRNRRECFEKVLTLSRWWIGEMREKGD